MGGGGRDGQLRRHWANPELWVTCALGPYNFEFMPAVLREIVTRYASTASSPTAGPGHGTCYCEHCRRQFQAGGGP